MIVAIFRIWNQIRTRADLNINKVSIFTHLTLLVIFIVLNLTTVSFELSGVIIRLDNDEDKWLLDITLLEFSLLFTQIFVLILTFKLSRPTFIK